MNEIKRLRRNRYKILKNCPLEKARLSVFKSCSHVSVQLIQKDGNILFDVNTIAKSCPVRNSSKQEKARWVGVECARKWAEMNKDNVSRVVYDRGKYKYHGIVKVVADAAREAGMEF